MRALVYGTAWKREATADLVVRAIRAGFRSIDTACQPKHYREDLVGAAIARVAADGFSASRCFFRQSSRRSTGKIRTRCLTTPARRSPSR